VLNTSVRPCESECNTSEECSVYPVSSVLEAKKSNAEMEKKRGGHNIFASCFVCITEYFLLYFIVEIM
jgi:hypothetical protein